MSGCLIAFLVFLGLGTLGAIGAGVWFYAEFGEFIGASGEMAQVILEAQKGPGTKEMRDEGCDEAISLDMEKFTDVVQRFEDEVARREGRLSKRQDLDDLDAAHVLSCKVNFGDAPSCKKIAKAFLGATKPDGKLVVTVTKGTLQQCSEIYDEDGKLIGDAKGVTLPTP